MTKARWRSLACLCLLPALSGCLFSRTKTVIKTHPPAQVLSSSLDGIVKATEQRYNAIQSLTASVEVVASTGGGKQGKVIEYPSFSANILFRKPDDMHFIGFVPVVHTKMIDMITDGKTFTISIPPRSRAITGSNAAPPTPSENAFENLRPDMFTDSLLIRSQQPEELVSLVSDDRIYQPNPTKKYVIDEPEYDLGIYTSVPGSTELKSRRVIHIGRATLLPYQQDIYDDKGQLATVATYEAYKRFGDTTFPSRITIERPVDQLKLVLTITKLAVNQPLEDDQFQLTIPKNYQQQNLP